MFRVLYKHSERGEIALDIPMDERVYLGSLIDHLSKSKINARDGDTGEMFSFVPVRTEYVRDIKEK